MPKKIELIKHRSSSLSSKSSKKVKQTPENGEFLKQQMIIASKNGEFLKQQMIIASKNGWKTKFYGRPFHIICEEEIVKIILTGNDISIYSGINSKSSFEMHAFPIEMILFEHSFCKTLWGEKEILIGFQVVPRTAIDANLKKEIDSVIKDSTWTIKELAWQYHIKKMALSEDRLQYLKDNPGEEL